MKHLQAASALYPFSALSQRATACGVKRSWSLNAVALMTIVMDQIRGGPI